MSADSLSNLLEACSLTGQEQDQLQSQLSPFPHTCQQQDLQQLTPAKLRRLKSGLESALSVGHETTMETARYRNLLAYTLHCLDQPQAALQQLDMVLGMEDQRHNLVTLANKAVILHSQQQLSEAQEQVQALRAIQEEDDDFGYLVVKAKAELAFTYTRLGPKFSPRAVALFEEVLQQAREPEKWLWSFGLSLTKRRQLRMHPDTFTPMPPKETADEQRGLLQQLKEIAEHCSSSKLKAKTFAEIALLLDMVFRTPLSSEFCFRAQMTREKACEKALQLDDNDNSVLCKTGRIFRHFRKTERSRDLLEKAVRIRPSSTAYHHLGITYKALATIKKNRQHNDQPHWRQGSRPGSAGSYYSLSQQFGQMSVGSSGYSSGVSRGLQGTSTPGAGSGTPLSQDEDVRNMQKRIKSPARNVTHFSRADPYVEDAVRNLRKAVEFSEGKNAMAQRDLALLLKAMGELEDAKNNLLSLQTETLCDADVISVYEQLGLVMKEQAEVEEDETKKKHLEQNSSAMLMKALTAASRVYKRAPQVNMGEVLHSFPILMQEAEATSARTDHKLKEKAKLCQLIRDHKQSLDLLQEIEQMKSNEANEPEYLKLRIENYVEIEDYMKASTFVELLDCTSQSQATRELFEDKQYVLKIFLRLAQEALQQGSPDTAQHFREAFQEAMKAHPVEASSSEYVDTDAKEDHVDKWDVGILHEESTEEDAMSLAETLKHTCGLKVCTNQDIAANKLELEGEIHNVKNSQLVVVLAGGSISRRMRLKISNIAKRPSIVTLLVEGQQVPELLEAHRRLDCTDGVMASLRQAARHGGQTNQSVAHDVFRIFCFLVDVKGM